MAEKLMTNRQVAAKVAWEGLGACVQHCLGHEHIKDPALGKLWLQAKEALDGIDKMLNKYNKYYE